MALPINGTLSMSQIAAEFNTGFSGPQSMSKYFSGGPFVPSGTRNASGAVIPTAGTLKVTDFYGATEGFVLVANNVASNSRIGKLFANAAGSSITPAVFKGLTISQVNYDFGGPPFFVFSMLKADTNPLPNNFFQSVVINGRTYLSSAASNHFEFTGPPQSAWVWDGFTSNLTLGGTYSVQIT